MEQRPQNHRKEKHMSKFNFGALIWRIDLVFGTKKAFCEAANISTATLNNYLRGASYMPSDFIASACALLSIPADEIGHYFFNRNVDY
ncbi:MAG: hypothetical protein MJ000_10930 [Bacteroidales bacterium]|nr:hypothetical protein [Bacteroidales bacterium]